MDGLGNAFFGGRWTRCPLGAAASQAVEGGDGGSKEKETEANEVAFGGVPKYFAREAACLGGGGGGGDGGAEMVVQCWALSFLAFCIGFAHRPHALILSCFGSDHLLGLCW
jgi:hypothetical protein